MLLPDEKIDFSAIREIYDHLQDQVTRLLHTLEATRREVEELKNERDELLQFKTQTVGFYSMMQRGISNFAFTPHAAPPFIHKDPPSPLTPTVATSQTLLSQQILHADFKSSRTYTTPAQNTAFPVPSTHSAAQTMDSSTSAVPVSISAIQSAEPPPSDPVSDPTNSPSSSTKPAPHLSKFAKSSNDLPQPQDNSADGGSSELRKNESPCITQQSIQSPSFQPVDQGSGGNAAEVVDWEVQFPAGEGRIDDDNDEQSESEHDSDCF
jgi:hypothetical protein